MLEKIIKNARPIISVPPPYPDDEEERRRRMRASSMFLQSPTSVTQDEPLVMAAAEPDRPGRAFLQTAIERIGSMIGSAHARADEQGRAPVWHDYAHGMAQDVSPSIIVPPPATSGSAYRNEPNVDEQVDTFADGRPSQAEPMAKVSSDKIIRESMGPRDGTGGMGISAGLVPPAPSISVPPPLPPVSSSYPALEHATRRLEVLQSSLPTDKIVENADGTYTVIPGGAKRRGFKGRLISAAIDGLRSAGEQAKEEMHSAHPSLTHVLGAGLGAGTVGAISPDSESKIERDQQIAEATKDVRTDLGIAHGQEQLNEMRALEDARRNGAANKPRSQALSELSKRIQWMGGSYRPGKDPRADQLAQQVGAPSASGKGGGMNPAFLKTVGGKLVYTDPRTQTPIVVFDATGEMTALDRQRNAIALESLNVQRARIGEAPLAIAEDLEASGGLSVPSPSAASSNSSPAPTAEAAPAPADSPRISVPAPRGVLVPSGAPAPVIPQRPWRGGRRGGGGRGGYGGGGDTKGKSIAYNMAMSSIERIEQLRTTADSLYKAGKYEKADGVISEMNTLADTLQSNPNTRGLVNVTTGSDHRGKPWKKVTLVDSSAPSGGGAASSGKVATRGHVADYAKKKGISVDDARREFEQSGYRIQ
jgi:hypothetical protein